LLPTASRRERGAALFFDRSVPHMAKPLRSQPTSRHRLPSAGRVAACVAFVAALAGCGNDTASTPDSQVAVRINKSDISVHQIQAVMQRQPRLLADQPEAAAARVLDILVEQELAAQAGREQGLDRDPAIVQALEVARREVLARAYQDQVAAKATGPTSEEIDRYYDSRPEVFAQRRLYTLKEFIVEATPQQMTRVQELARQARSADELNTLLVNNALRNRTRQFVQAAEDVPLAVLAPLAKLDNGQSLVLPHAAGARIFTIVHATPAPVDRRTAADAITAFLTNESKRALVAQAMKTLRDGATISYQGAFAKAGAAASAPP
jgi:EpsD family peptidyl-prolyl cis-trans isomerase